MSLRVWCSIAIKKYLLSKLIKNRKKETREKKRPSDNFACDWKQMQLKALIWKWKCLKIAIESLVPCLQTGVWMGYVFFVYMQMKPSPIEMFRKSVRFGFFFFLLFCFRQLECGIWCTIWGWYTRDLEQRSVIFLWVKIWYVSTIHLIFFSKEPSETIFVDRSIQSINSYYFVILFPSNGNKIYVSFLNVDSFSWILFKFEIWN